MRIARKTSDASDQTTMQASVARATSNAAARARLPWAVVATVEAASSSFGRGIRGGRVYGAAVGSVVRRNVRRVGFGAGVGGGAIAAGFDRHTALARVD